MKRSYLLGAAAPALMLATGLFAPHTAQAATGKLENAVTADPPVSRPSTTPIIVPLYTNDAFSTYGPMPFQYTPPTNTGPWSKIVLVADFTENAGNQYDRTCTISVGGANIYFGTTPEPTSTLGPTWHVERDVSDYASLLATSQPGAVDLFNIYNSTYNGLPVGSAYLEFYPSSPTVPAAKVPDLVVPLTMTDTGSGLGSTGNNPAYLNDATDTLYETTTFPTNVTSAYLDLITQPQGSDEFWYGNVPDDLVDTLDEYGGTSFREAEITVDDKPAGVAPVYPWIFTGGIDPDLWLPIPGVQTLNFKPYRVDLTPFAALLDDGMQHTVAVSVYNDDNYFSVTGSLLLYRDPHLAQVTGSLLQDTIAAAPSPNISETVADPSAEDVIGEINTTSDRQFTTMGVVNTSKGAVITKNVETIDFSNAQVDPVLVDASGNVSFIQNITQNTSVDSLTTTTSGSSSRIEHKSLSYPLTVDYTETINSSFTELLALDAGVHQGFLENATLATPTSLFSSSTSNIVNSNDSIPTTYPRASNQTYTYSDTNGHNYVGKVTSQNGLVTSNTKSGSLPVHSPVY